MDGFPAIDVGFLATTPPEQRTPEETNLLALAQTNGNTLLEIADIYSSIDCRSTPATEPLSATCRQRALGLFQSHRHTVMQLLLKHHAPTLLNVWPDLQLEHLTTLCETYAPNETDLAATIARLVAVATHHPTLREGNAKMLLCFAAVWLIIHNLGVAYAQWLRTGGKPVRDLPVEAFTRNTLQRLESGQITVGVVPEGLPSAALYDPERNMLLLQPDYIDHLSSSTSSLAKGRPPLACVAGHELFHAEFDARRQPSRVSRHEVDATIFGYKTYILTQGQEGLETLQHTETTDLRAAFVRGDAELSQRFGGTAKFFADVGTTEYLVLFNEHALDLAQEELRTGTMNQKRRQTLAIEYSRAHAYIAIIGNHQANIEWALKVMKSLHATSLDDPVVLANLRERLTPILGQEPKKSFTISPIEWRNLQQGTMKTQDAVTEQLDAYIGAKVVYVSALYYLQGADVAHRYYQDAIMTIPVEDTVIRYFSIHRTLEDGLPPPAKEHP